MSNSIAELQITCPDWCMDHVLDDDGASSGLCESRKIEAGSLSIFLSSELGGAEGHVDVVQQPGGRHIGIPAAEIKSLIGALLWAKSQVAP